MKTGFIEQLQHAQFQKHTIQKMLKEKRYSDYFEKIGLEIKIKSLNRDIRKAERWLKNA